eukprot:1059928-Pyramimonas_sp.AAC.1
MIRGDMYKCERLSMTLLVARRYFKDMGIPPNWSPMQMCLADPKVVQSDVSAERLASLVCALTLEHTKRNLTFSHGYPRRQ